VDSSASPVGTLTVTTGNSGATYTLGYNAGVDGLLGNLPELIATTDAETSTQVGQVFRYFAARYGNTWH
jgi:hypothetical protein